jgi:stage II sporulation protein D
MGEYFMKNIRLQFMIIIITLSLGFSANAAQVTESQKVPEYVRIGLYYLEKSLDSVQISADIGFNIGYSENEEFKNIMNLQSEKIIVKKDNQTSNNSGAYHIQIDGTFKSYTEAKKAASDFVKLKYNAYPVYEDGFKVYLGVFNTQIEANTQLAKLKKAFATHKFLLITPNQNRIQITNTNGEIQSIFASSTAVLEIKPIPGDDGIDVLGVNGKNYRGNIRIIRKKIVI